MTMRTCEQDVDGGQCDDDVLAQVGHGASTVTAREDTTMDYTKTIESTFPSMRLCGRSRRPSPLMGSAR